MEVFDSGCEASTNTHRTAYAHHTVRKRAIDTYLLWQRLAILERSSCAGPGDPPSSSCSTNTGSFVLRGALARTPMVVFLFLPRIGSFHDLSPSSSFPPYPPSCIKSAGTADRSSGVASVVETARVWGSLSGAENRGDEVPGGTGAPGLRIQLQRADRGLGAAEGAEAPDLRARLRPADRGGGVSVGSEADQLRVLL